MSKNILIIDAHPDAGRGRFIHALADAYAYGAKHSGHEVRRLELATMDIPFLRSRADWTDGQPEPQIIAAQEAIRWANHIVFLYPLWLGARSGFDCNQRSGLRTGS